MTLHIRQVVYRACENLKASKNKNVQRPKVNLMDELPSVNFKVSFSLRKWTCYEIFLSFWQNFLNFGWSQLAGRNSHHIIEATFKAFARALRQALEYDPRRLGSIPRFDKNLFQLKMNTLNG